ncbi:LapA family protein [Pseudomonas sp. RGM2987]|uniref:lipopolysaccharide assembly protein LapA domain-containing protein n=1 Tax=Pseudomonas sp. RGM2987 TaxID=2930090 RepID=UPI001FD70272|nr:LapA family protein [Pseudomonas sp. RGM2987]MCJ8205248.1 LapA family protein [Pseudomonas sp. RGM2987]
MRSLKRIFLVVSGLLLIMMVLAFVLENQQSVAVLFLGWAGPQLPVSVLMIAALLVGMVIGPILGWLFMRRSGASGKRLV